MTLLETSVDVVVALTPPAATTNPSDSLLRNLKQHDDLPYHESSRSGSSSTSSSPLSMEQDQEEDSSPSVSYTTPSTTPTSTSTHRLTLNSVASASFNCLPALEENHPRLLPRSREHQAASCPPQRRREVSFDVSYDAHHLRRARSSVAASIASAAEAYATDTNDEDGSAKRPTWVPDWEAPECQQCAKKFHVIRRRHHCRACGGVFCAACSSNRITIPRLEYTSSEVRVCDHCWVREAELRYRKPSSGRRLSTALRRPRRQSLSHSSEIEINKGLLKRSLRNVTPPDATPGAVEEEEGTMERRAESEDAGHERKENQ